MNKIVATTVFMEECRGLKIGWRQQRDRGLFIGSRVDSKIIIFNGRFAL